MLMGTTFVPQITKAHPGMPIIFLTAKTETEDIVRGFESGGTDYVRKPFSMDELVARINNQLKAYGREQDQSVRWTGDQSRKILTSYSQIRA
jgi:DNA-binding response OmpR family regulator